MPGYPIATRCTAFDGQPGWLACLEVVNLSSAIETAAAASCVNPAGTTRVIECPARGSMMFSGMRACCPEEYFSPREREILRARTTSAAPAEEPAEETTEESSTASSVVDAVKEGVQEAFGTFTGFFRKPEDAQPSFFETGAKNGVTPSTMSRPTPGWEPQPEPRAPRAQTLHWVLGGVAVVTVAGIVFWTVRDREKV